MQGLELSRRFFEEVARPLWEVEFAGLMPYLAVGLVGHGSECYGYDDELSRDHDFEPGFCVFLPDEAAVNRRSEFLLERAYSALPKEFAGLKRSPLSPVGGNRHGVFRTSDYYRTMTGKGGAPESWRDFLALPDYALCEVTNGAVFYDGLGEFTALRQAWSTPPRDVQYKKVCGFLLSMSQTGEYNYPRTLARSDTGAARLTAHEFVKSAMGAAFWMRNRPVPYYKWCFRAMRDLGGCGELASLLGDILAAENAAEPITAAIREVLRLFGESGLLPTAENDLQKVAVRLNNRIEDADLRNASLLAAV